MAGGGDKMSEWKLALWHCFTCVSVTLPHPPKASINSFHLIQFMPTLRKDTVSVQQGQRRRQRWAKNTNVYVTDGPELWWNTDMCHSHIKRHSKSHSKPVMEKTTTCFLSPKTVYNKERKLKKKKKKDVPRSQTTFPFNIVAHSGLIEEAFSGHCYHRFPAWFIFSAVSVFLHTHCFYML